MDLTVIVQARMGSSRLPGKVLRPIAGRPMLAVMLDRLAQLSPATVVIATSDLDRDDEIASFAADHGMLCTRGSEHDVLERFAGAADAHPATHIVRLTADCPLIDPGVVREVLDTHLRTGADYTSNTLLRTYPDGLDVEVLSSEALAVARREAKRPDEREHVTPYIIRHPDRFRLAAHLGPLDLEDERWTVDTLEDFAFVDELLSREPNLQRASWLDVLASVGVRRSAAAGAVVLRVDRSTVADPGARRWRIRRDDADLGHVCVRVRDGLGELSVAFARHDHPEVNALELRDALETRLRADLQVRELSLTPEGTRT